MRKEWNGSLVGKDEYEEKHPQLEPANVRADNEAHFGTVIRICNRISRAGYSPIMASRKQ